jgi:hypothetical protein
MGWVKQFFWEPSVGYFSFFVLHLKASKALSFSFVFPHLGGSENGIYPPSGYFQRVNDDSPVDS